jgi:hypothetical protein
LSNDAKEIKSDASTQLSPWQFFSGTNDANARPGYAYRRDT